MQSFIIVSISVNPLENGLVEHKEDPAMYRCLYGHQDVIFSYILFIHDGLEGVLLHLCLDGYNEVSCSHYA